MTRRHVALSLTLAGLLLAAALPASAQSAREEASLADLVRLLQSQDATEEELAAALSAAESLLGNPPACDPENPMFNDVPADSIFCPFIEELARRGLTEGCGGGNFCPADPVSRAQMTTFIVKAMNTPRRGYAVVTSEGSLSRGFNPWGETIFVDHVLTGVYNVHFEGAPPLENGQDCAWVASAGLPGLGIAPAVIATVSAVNDGGMSVRLYDLDGVQVNASFHLLLSC